MSAFSRNSDDEGGISRVSSRWGEYEVTQNGKDQRLYDGLSRFRNDFDCCHQVPVEGCSHNKFDGHMIPKPNNVDCSVIGDTKTYRTSSKAREARFEVFPRNISTRTDPQGNYILEQRTRDAIDRFHKKLYCIPKHGCQYPDSREFGEETEDLLNSRSECEAGKPKRVRFADDIGYNLEIKPTPRQDLEAIMNPERWPQFDKEPRNDQSGPDAFCTYATSLQNSSPTVESYEHPFNAPVPINIINEENNVRTVDMDVNQNYHFLTSTIYNYRIPSALHQPDEVFIPDLYPVDVAKNEDNSDKCCKRPVTYMRPTYPKRLLADMKSVKDEMNLMNKKVPVVPRSMPLLHQTDIPCSVDQWVDSADSEKAILKGKSDLQRRYHEEHPEALPDLRDHKTYTKKVFFDGFNSSAYRG